jgi:hypothetical protein
MELCKGEDEIADASVGIVGVMSTTNPERKVLR